VWRGVVPENPERRTGAGIFQRTNHATATQPPDVMSTTSNFGRRKISRNIKRPPPSRLAALNGLNRPKVQ
jgi:hypothetical protein